MLHMDMALAERHYALTRITLFQKPDELYQFGAHCSRVFEGEGAIDLIRKIMGAPTAKAADGTIRGDLGVDIEHYSIHGSDS
jgi:nucleoside-diphosphate kinase